MKTKLLLATFLCFLPLHFSLAQTLDEIIRKATDARGGIDKIKAVQSERITGRVTFSQGFEGTLVLELQRPHKLYSEITVEGQKVVRVYDGKSAGWTVNPFTENKDVVEMSADELKEMPDETDLDGPLVDYKIKGSQAELVGKEDVQGKAVYRLKITSKSGEVRSYLIDGATFLTTKWEGIRKVGDQNLPWECTLSDYREVQGLKFPFKIDQGSPGTEYNQTLTVEKVEINPKIDESHFAKPAELKAPAATAPSGSQAMSPGDARHREQFTEFGKCDGDDKDQRRNTSARGRT
jgi:outer membrane lipoprotein-sorting protein